jgi:hypothetical protein
MNSDVVIGNTCGGGPPHNANVLPDSTTYRSLVIARSTMFRTDRRVCSSIIDAIFTASPATVESN